jgi:enoyl-CoA hydratase/carnithine racemase
MSHGLMGQDVRERRCRREAAVDAALDEVERAHDLRVMRSDRGFWCLPEADIGIPFTPAMSALIQARLAPQTAHVAMTSARRYGGGDALASGIVDCAVAEDAVRSTAVDLAAAQAGKAGATLGTNKARMYAPVLELLREGTGARG